MTYRLFEINKGGVIILSCLTNLETCKELRAGAESGIKSIVQYIAKTCKS